MRSLAELENLEGLIYQRRDHRDPPKIPKQPDQSSNEHGTRLIALSLPCCSIGRVVEKVSAEPKTFLIRPGQRIFVPISPTMGMRAARLPINVDI